MKTRISGKEAARVAEDMAKPGPIRVVAASEAVAAHRSPRGTRPLSCHRPGPSWTESLCLVMINGRHPRPTWKDIEKGCARRSATLFAEYDEYVMPILSGNMELFLAGRFVDMRNFVPH